VIQNLYATVKFKKIRLKNVFEMVQMRATRRAVDPNKLYTKIVKIIIGEGNGLLEMVQ